jgi:pyridoxamine 5'-phosphate oxidase like protein
MNAKQRVAAPRHGQSPASAVYGAGAAQLLLPRKPKRATLISNPPGIGEMPIKIARSSCAVKERPDVLDTDAMEVRDDAYVTFVGWAALVEDRSEIRSRWQETWNAYFPSGKEDPNAIFIRVEVDQIELWVRGVTPEPFGLRPSVLHRDSANCWNVVSG